MKKIIVMLMVMMAAISSVCFAHSVPNVFRIDVKISNPEGAKYYSDYRYDNNKEECYFSEDDLAGTLSHDKIVKCETELNNNYRNSIFDIFINDEKYCINAKDITPLNDEMIPKEILSSSNANVLTEKGIKMYKGPSILYSEIEDIPKGEEVKVYRTTWDNNSYEYAEYNGKKGWIVVEENIGFLPVNKEQKYACGNLEINDSVNYLYNPNTIGTIKNLEPINNYLYVRYSDIHPLYVNIGNVSGYIPDMLAIKSNGAIYVARNINIDYDDGTQGEIPYGTVLEYDYDSADDYWFDYNCNDYWKCHVDYMGKKGWVDLDSVDGIHLFLNEELCKLALESDKKVIIQNPNTPRGLDGYYIEDSKGKIIHLEDVEMLEYSKVELVASYDYNDEYKVYLNYSGEEYTMEFMRGEYILLEDLKTALLNYDGEIVIEKLNEKTENHNNSNSGSNQLSGENIMQIKPLAPDRDKPKNIVLYVCAVAATVIVILIIIFLKNRNKKK